MQPVRTVPFFNLYDDIQITQLGAYNDRFQRDMQAPLTGFMPESSRTPRSDPGSPEEVGGFCPATISSVPLGTPQVTPNDTQRHFSARIWAFWAPGHCAIQPVRTVPKHLPSQTCLRVRDDSIIDRVG